MLTLYHSNQQEQLIQQLAQITSQGRAHPFVAETIISQSPGMARWISIQLAEQLGIAAHYDFPLPSSFFWRLFTEQFPELGSTSGYEKPVLTWRIMKLLPELLQQPAFEPLKRYLEDEDPRRDYQLARRISDTLDQYLIYRPEMVLEWEASQEQSDWQAMLWRELVKDTGNRPNRAQLLQGFIQNCEQGRLDAAALPARLNFFGISTLPPAYLQLLHCLAQHTEVNIFLLNPCPYYWGDIQDQKVIARRRSKLRLSGQQQQEDYLITGNRLLASMGKQGRDYVDTLINLDPIEQELYHEGFADTLLGRAQRDIYELDEIQREGYEADDSLTLHSCHSPMREVEVLHDQLLDLFNKDPDLQADDVIIMTPDVEAYAPYIEAVFNAAEERQQLPWTLSDRTLVGELPEVRAFIQVLEVAAGRFEASQVLALLENPAILKRYQLDEQQFEQIRHWVQQSGIRWGLGKQAQQPLGMPDDLHSWAFGLRRLLLGYSLPADTELYQDIAPFPHIEGNAVVALGQLLQFLEQLQWLQAQLQGEHQARQWIEVLNRTLERFFPEDDDTEAALKWIRTALGELQQEQEDAGYEQVMGLPILRDYLESSFNNTLSDTRFLNGKLTICTLLPMRSLPFKVVMMIGMNEGSFPRQNRPLGFDRIAQDPKSGDRSRREDDRYLFLEALLSARQSLYISYVGRDIRDNAPRLPSVLVTELLDYMEHCYGKAMRQALCIEHPMQAFSPQNFLAEAKLFSYAAHWLPGLQVLHTQQARDEAFADTSLPIQQENPWPLELNQLIRFYSHPPRAFLQQRLGLQFPYANELPKDEEPFELDSLQGYHIKQGLIPYLLDEQLDYGLDLLKAQGQLPVAGFGELKREELIDELQWFEEALPPLLEGKQEDLEIDIELAEMRLSGWLHNRYANGLLLYRPGQVRRQDLLSLWIQHLVHHVQTGPIDSHYLGRDEQLSLKALSREQAQQHLQELLVLYKEGMQQVLHFYPETSWACFKGEGKERETWLGSDFAHRTPESQDPYYELALRGQNPLDEAFEQLARQIYTPLQAAIQISEAEQEEPGDA